MPKPQSQAEQAGGDPFPPGQARPQDFIAGRRFDHDPSAGRKAHFSPEMQVLFNDGRVPRLGVVVVRRGIEAADQARGIFQQPQEHSRRRGELIVGPAAGHEKEVGQRVGLGVRRMCRWIELIVGPKMLHHRGNLRPTARLLVGPARYQEQEPRMEILGQKRASEESFSCFGKKPILLSRRGSTTRLSVSIVMPDGVLRSAKRKIYSWPQPKKLARFTLPTLNRMG